jgi:hypothetical protein
MVGFSFSTQPCILVPLLLGRMNFFLEFDVCFYRADLAFEVHSRKK